MSDTTAEHDPRFDAEPGAPAKTDTAKKDIVLRAAGQQVAVPPDKLRTLSFDELADYFGGTVHTADEAVGTDQFGPILKDKQALVGKPFVIVHWEFHPGDFGADFVSMWVLTQSDERYIVNDGSTGIAAQLREVTAEKGIDSMLVCKHGLRSSTYDYELPNGKSGEATTYYIDTSL